MPVSPSPTPGERELTASGSCSDPVLLAPLVDRELEQSCGPSHPSGGSPSLHGAHVLPRQLWPWGRQLALERQAGSVCSVQTPLWLGSIPGSLTDFHRGSHLILTASLGGSCGRDLTFMWLGGDLGCRGPSCVGILHLGTGYMDMFTVKI